MADTNIGTLTYKITGDTTSLDKSLNKSEKNVKGLGKESSSLGTLLKGAAVAGAVVFAAKKVAEFGLSAINAASDAEETRNKFNVVFKDISEEAEAAATNLSDNFGLSNQAAEDLLSGTGDLLTGFGFTGEAALDLSTQVNELAVDLASFTNFSGGAEGASDALTKALLGERESVKALGISILDADVKAKVLELTQQGLTFETERQAKAYATLQIAQEQSTNAIGDYARSSESFANKQREARAAVDDLKAAIGERLLPAATDSISIFGDLTAKVAEFIEERNRLKEVEQAAATGKGSTEDQIDGLRLLNDRINENIQTTKAAIEQNYVEQEVGQQLIDTYNAEIQANSDKIRNLTLESKVRKGLSEQLDEEEAAASARADSESKRIEQQQEYIAWVEDQYASTQEAKLEQLKEELTLLEENISLYGGLSEEQKTLIDLKKKEIAEIDGSAAAKKKEEEARVDAERQYAAAINDRATRQLAIDKEIEDSNTAVLDRLQENADNSILTWEAVGDILQTSVKTGLEGVGEALVNNEDVWGAVGNAALETLAAVVSAIGDQLAAQAALLYASAFFSAGASIAPAIAATAAAAAAYVASGAISAQAANFQDGGIVPGTSFSGDRVPANVNSGEMILNREQQTQLFDLANGIGQGGGSQHIVVNLDSKPILSAVSTGTKTGKLIIDSRSVK